MAPGRSGHWIFLVEMRVPSACEVLLLARILTRSAPVDRPKLAAAIFAEADAAERHLHRTGRVHPTFGDGSLMSRCMILCAPSEPLADDRDFLDCLALAANSMLAHSHC